MNMEIFTGFHICMAYPWTFSQKQHSTQNIGVIGDSYPQTHTHTVYKVRFEFNMLMLCLYCGRGDNNGNGSGGVCVFDEYDVNVYDSKPVE